MNLKILTFFLSFVLSSYYIEAQVAPEKYWLQFTDKSDTPFTIEAPEHYLSPRAIQRRINQNIPIVENDLPLTPLYVDSLKKLGLTILNKSKWFNAVTVHSTDTALLDTILNLSFIIDLQKVATFKGNVALPDKFKEPSRDEASLVSTWKACNTEGLFDYGMSANQIEMLNGHIIHNQGYLGQGMHIAVIDAGFYRVDSLPAFDSLWANNQILGTRDFVDGDTIVFDEHSHGTAVLSIIGGNIPGQLIGTAPKASFWLLRSEDGATEFVIEEDNWVAAAEFADSAGVDIINTSLGYSVFNDPDQDHTYADMDGNSTRISIGADIASSKGILVVISAGNSGGSTWQYITAPADADSVLTVGAVDEYGNYASFSSTGPTYDGRIKPNIVAKGYQTAVQNTNGDIVTGNGTSFSSPLITGMVACLWQAYPELTNMQILDAIEQSADQYSNPDYLKGYGIPDFAKACSDIRKKYYAEFHIKNVINAYPNPFDDYLNIEFYSFDNQDIKIEIFDMLGKIVATGKVKFDYSCTCYDKLNISKLSRLSNGIYILKISTDTKIYQHKLMKL